MPHGFRYSQLLRMVAKATRAFRVNDWTLNRIDPDGLGYLGLGSVVAPWPGRPADHPRRCPTR